MFDDTQNYNYEKVSRKLFYDLNIKSAVSSF